MSPSVPLVDPNSWGGSLLLQSQRQRLDLCLILPVLVSHVHTFSRVDYQQREATVTAAIILNHLYQKSTFATWATTAVSTTASALRSPTSAGAGGASTSTRTAEPAAVSADRSPQSSVWNCRFFFYWFNWNSPLQGRITALAALTAVSRSSPAQRTRVCASAGKASLSGLMGKHARVSLPGYGHVTRSLTAMCVCVCVCSQSCGVCRDGSLR